MSGTFPGRIQLAEGDEVDVDLQIAAEKIRLATPFAEIGLWDRDSIHFERSSTGGYELSVADDVVTFYPTDVTAFAEAVDEMLAKGESSDEPTAVPPVALVPSLLDDDTADLEAEDSQSPDVLDADTEDEASRFGPSSRERLVAAMASFKARQEAEEFEVEEEDTEMVEFDAIDEADADVAAVRTSSPGFVIPGDDDYRDPSGEDDYEDYEDDHEDDYEDDYGDEHPIHFDEELGDDTVADQIIETSRSLRSARSLSLDKAKLKKAGIAAAVVVVMAALAFAVPVVIDFFSSDDASPETASQTTIPVTTPQETTPPSTAPAVDTPIATVEPLAFELTSIGFVERWNETAALVSPNLRFRSSLPASDFEVGFTTYIAMVGSFNGPGGGLEAYTLEVDPTGPSSSDRLGIQALGLAIAVADPSLEPSERAAVLAETGFNVRDPQLGGLNGITTWNDVNYRLVYDAEDVVLRLTVSPRSP